MAKPLNIEDVIVPDQLGCYIADKYVAWENHRAAKVAEWDEVQSYIFATDTTKTSNNKLPWSNKTTLPKLCQIRDNLYANYMAALFPKRKWLEWIGDDQESDDPEKRHMIESYMLWVSDRPDFYTTVSRLVLDYIDYGNCFAMPDWQDATQILDNPLRETQGYVGPTLKRISPLDIVFDPTAPSFYKSPKIIRSYISLGEIKEILLQQSATEEEKAVAQEMYSYLKDIRQGISDYKGTIRSKDERYKIDGFDSYRSYMASNVVEVLTFYGDIYDEDTDTYKRNHVLKIVDRHKVIYDKPNPSLFDGPPIYHVGWRLRPDNLWAMGPLDNIVGMQYRIDHLENMKADVFDLIAYPPLKIKGDPADFTWGPFERIYVGDSGDVDLMSPNVQALQADTQIALLEQKMEEMAGSPRQAMGFRTPGEKTAFEVQTLENAASRIFMSKTSQMERDGLELWLNAMLELARRKTTTASIRVLDEENKVNDFFNLTAADLTGVGRLRPMAARQFAEKAQLVQNLTALNQSILSTDPETKQHFSSIQLAKLLETSLDLEGYDLVHPYIRITEQTEAQRYAAVNEETLMSEIDTPSGLDADDFDEDVFANQPEGPIDDVL